MFKTKTQVLILLFTILTLITTISFASEAVVTSEDASTTSEVAENTVEESSEDQEIYNDDLYLFGDDIVMDKLVDGNVYIMANKVSVTGQINGNLFVLAQDFSLNDAYVRNSIFLCATNATFNGACTDLYAACDKLDVSYESYIARDSRIGCDDLVFKALNSRNMFISASKIDFGADSEAATIYGNLDYTSSKELTLAEGVVSGEVTYTPEEITDAQSSTDVVSILLSIVSTLIYSIIVYFIIRWFTPNFEEGISQYASKKIIFAFLIGLVALIVIPIISILLLFSPIASGLAIALATVYALLISISFAVFSLFVAKLLAKKIKKIPELGLFAIVTVVLALLRIAPYVSFIVSFIMGISGFGMIVVSLFKRCTSNKKAVETTSIESTTESNNE